jgi:hypothetical protein
VGKKPDRLFHLSFNSSLKVGLQGTPIVSGAGLLSVRELDERELRYNDPGSGIDWPIDPVEDSAKDDAHPDFSKEYHLNATLKEMSA